MKPHVATLSVLAVVSSMVAVAVLFGGDPEAPTAFAGEKPAPKPASEAKKSVDCETSCISCHTPVAENDWVYVYGYPDLKQPKK